MEKVGFQYERDIILADYPCSIPYETLIKRILVRLM